MSMSDLHAYMLLLAKTSRIRLNGNELAFHCHMIIPGMRQEYLKKEEDNLSREQIDRAGGGCGRVADPPPTVGTFGISGIKTSCFNAF